MGSGPTMLAEEVRELDEGAFNDLLATADRLVVVEFFMEGCPACGAMAPVFDDLAREMSGVVFARIDVRVNLDTALRYGVVATPTFLLFCRGVFLEEMIGVISPEALRKVIADILELRPECAGKPITTP